LTGGYAGLIEAERRALTLRSPGQLLFWGERLSGDRRIKAAVRRLYFAGFDGVLAVGTWAVDSYRTVARSAPVHVFPYTTGASGQRERAPAPTPVIGFVGDLIERKGVDILVESLACVPEGNRPALEVAGDGPAREGLAQRARDLGVTVEWLGHLPADELQARQRRWWAQAVPSRYDGWGIVVAEALAAGVPVLASSRAGAAVDLVRDGVNGAVVRPGQDWAPVLQRYTDMDVVVREGRGARLVGQAFSADAAAGWLSRLLLDGAKTAPPRSFVEEAWHGLEGALDDC
jgi:glycosyltransferase involved in cell wall biosynthesis